MTLRRICSLLESSGTLCREFGFCAETIEEFALRARVSPGIVVGHLQHEDRMPWRNNLNSLKAMCEWSYGQRSDKVQGVSIRKCPKEAKTL